MRHKILVAALLCVTPSILLPQQGIGGYARELSSGKPLSCFPVELQDSTGIALDSTHTFRDGFFAFTLRDPGWYRLRFHWDKITDVVTPPVLVSSGAVTESVFRVALFLDSAWTDSLRRGRFPESDGRVHRLRSAVPSYPWALQQAAIEGDVAFLYAIDGRGTVDTASAIPLVSSHPLFLASVVAALPRVRYRAQVYEGDCTLVVQPFSFRLTRE